MALLEIKKYPDPILRKKSKEIKEITPEISRLIEDMKKTIVKANGIGLSGPQVGVLKRVIVVQTESGPKGFINPKIIKKGKEIEIMEEGCLSFSGLFLKIKRAREAVVEILNEKGEKIQIKAEGLLARIFQHEIDHLDGILFFNRLSFWQRLKIKGKLRNF